MPPPIRNLPVLLVLLLSLAAIGCGASSARGVAYDTINIAITAVKVVDHANGAAMAATRDAHLGDPTTTAEEEIQRRSPFWRVQESTAAARAILTAAELAVDAHGADGLRELAPCILEILARLREAVTVLNQVTHGVVPEIEIPPDIDSVLRLLSAFTGTCEPGAA